MKNCLKTTRINVLLYTIIYLAIYFILKVILSFLNLDYLQWIKNITLIIGIVGIIVGAIQMILKTENKTVKIIIITVLIIISIIGIILGQLIAFIYISVFVPEHIVIKDGQKMVAYVYSFLDVRVEYYEYKNIFIRGNNVIYEEYYGSGGYDPFDSEHKDSKAIKSYKYDEEGKIIERNGEPYTPDIIEDNSTENKTNYNNAEREETTGETWGSSPILYEKKFDDTTSIRIVNKGAVLAQRSIIGIEKTTDGGENWEEQLETSDGFIQIHNGAEFIFINENIGFINDPGLSGTNGDNRDLLVTIDGGKNFEKANIIHPQEIKERNLFVSEVPYMEDGKLKVKVYTINYANSPVTTYYEFYSEDNGLNWKYSRKIV